LTAPAGGVEILEFNEFGPKLAVRPYCNTRHYWQVYFDSNKAIADTLGAAGFPVATHPVKLYPLESSSPALLPTS
jgi:small conductance mechanosensitive channel